MLSRLQMLYIWIRIIHAGKKIFMNKIGLVLSGGGARGFAHLGLLKALDELGVKLFAISGVSAGALLGAMYAEGKSPDEILALCKDNSYFGLSNLLWRKAGF